MWFFLALVAILMTGLLLIFTVIQFEVGSPAARRWLVYSLCSVVALAYVLASRPPREQVEYSYLPPPAVQELKEPEADKKGKQAAPETPGSLPVTGLEEAAARIQRPPAAGTGMLQPGVPAVPPPDSTPKEPPFKRAVVNTASLNVRAEPDFNARVCDVVKAGMELVILEETGNSPWVKVRTGDFALTGWVHKNYLKILPLQ